MLSAVPLGNSPLFRTAFANSPINKRFEALFNPVLANDSKVKAQKLRIGPGIWMCLPWQPHRPPGKHFIMHSNEKVTAWVKLQTSVTASGYRHSFSRPHFAWRLCAGVSSLRNVWSCLRLRTNRSSNGSCYKVVVRSHWSSKRFV